MAFPCLATAAFLPMAAFVFNADFAVALTYQAAPPGFRAGIPVDPNGGAITFTYDAVGRLATVKDANNATTTYAYDEVGSNGVPPINRTLPIGANMAQEVFHGEAGSCGGIQA